MQKINNLKLARIDYAVFIIITLISLWFGKTTLFYLIYLFWWNELIRKLVGFYFFKKSNKVSSVDQKGSFFLLAIYFVFILVFFGFIANFKNTDLMLVNMEVLTFQNWFFNINLIWIIAENIWLHKSGNGASVSLSAFSANAIVMHISIILGGILMFMVVFRYPDFFSPNNFGGMVLISSPFLILKFIAQVYFGEKAQEDNNL